LEEEVEHKDKVAHQRLDHIRLMVEVMVVVQMQLLVLVVVVLVAVVLVLITQVAQQVIPHRLRHLKVQMVVVVVVLVVVVVQQAVEVEVVEPQAELVLTG
jgi:hypothetical protein